MKTLERLFSLLLLAAISLGLSFFLSIYYQSGNFTFLDHGFRFDAVFTLVWSMAALAVLVLLWLLLPRIEQRFLSADRKVIQRQDLISLLPAALGLLSPLMLRHYLTSDDLRTRLVLLLGAMLIGGTILKAFQYHRSYKGRHLWDLLVDRFSRFSRRKRLLILFLAAFLANNLGALWLVTHGFAFSGDEPYYLLTANSLYQDQDINVANDYQENDYRRFYPPELYPKVRLGAYARFGKKGEESVYPISQPGVSILILPWYALSQLFKGRVLIFVIKSSLAVWGALLGLQLYLLFSQLWHSERLSLGLWLLTSFTVPVFFFSFHVYPAVPIALFSVYIFRQALRKSPLPTLRYLLCGLLLATFPWFGLKYNLIFWPLLLVSLYHFMRDHRAGWKVLWFLAPPLAASAGFYLYVHHLYGTFNPIAIYEGVLTPDKVQNFREVMWHTPLMLRISSFFDYFLDQRDGLLLYSPWYFFALLGFIEMFRRARRTLMAFVLLAGPFVFNYAFFAHRQGSSPQGRVLTPLIWMGAVGVGYFILHNRKQLYGILFKLAVVISLVILFLLLFQPAWLYQPTTHEYTYRGADMFISLSNLHFHLPDLLPSFLKIDNLGYIPNYLWLGLILAFGIGYTINQNIRLPRGFALKAGSLLASALLFFMLFCLYPRPVLRVSENTSFASGERIAFYNLGPNVRVPGPGTFHLHAYGRTYDFIFTSRKPLKRLGLEFGPSQGETGVSLEAFDVPLYKGRLSGRMQTITQVDPPAYRYKNSYLYLLRVTLPVPENEVQRDHYFRLIFSPQD